MKSYIVALIQIAFFSFSVTAQDYNLIYESDNMGGATWFGSFTASVISGSQLGTRLYLNDGLPGSLVGFGITGCQALLPATDGSNSNGEYAILPIGRSLEVINDHPTSSVDIFYFTFLCDGNIPDHVLAPGERITLFHGKLDCIAPLDSGLCLPDPVPTLSQWAIINLSLLLLIFGSVHIQQRESLIISLI